MVNSYLLVGIAVGVFVAGIGIGYGIFLNTYNPYAAMMQPQFFNQMMTKNPQFTGQYFGYMMQNPQYMNQWMLQNPQYTDKFMGSMMQDPKLRQQMYDYMLQNKDFMYGMMSGSNFQNNWMYPYMKNNLKMGPGMMYNSTAYPYTSGQMGHGSMMGVQPFNWSQQLGNPTQVNQVVIPNEGWSARSGSHYVPYYIEVKSGTTVTWTNNDNIGHTATSVNDLFDSGIIQPGQTWSYSFNATGQYDYYCVLHPWMKGTVKVS